MNRSTTIVICFFLTLILGLFLIYPKYQDLRVLQEKNRIKRIELQSKEEYFLDLIDISEKLKGYKDQLSKIDSALPPNPDLPNLFKFLQIAVSQSGLILRGMSPTFAAPSETVRETRVDLMVTGSYSALKELLSLLERSARMIEIEFISLSSPEGPGSLNFNLKIKVYSY